MTSELKDKLLEKFKDKNISLNENREQLIMTVPVEAWLDSAFQLRDNPDFSFEVLIDLAGVDYSTYKDTLQQGPRFCAVYQFLSLKYNQRLRIKVFAENSAWPSVPSVVEVWSSANWYEREAYDLYGILFEGHPDLRRLLTDYGFVGHPFRKDFPITGHVEMRYDPEQKRVIYQPVTIEPRENTPRIVREDQYARFIQ